MVSLLDSYFSYCLITISDIKTIRICSPRSLDVYSNHSLLFFFVYIHVLLIQILHTLRQLLYLFLTLLILTAEANSTFPHTSRTSVFPIIFTTFQVSAFRTTELVIAFITFPSLPFTINTILTDSSLLQSSLPQL